MRDAARVVFVLSFLAFFLLLSGCTGLQGQGTGTLQFVSSPSGAEIYLDNQYRGTTPATVTDVAPGNHTLEFRSAGYISWSSPITVSSGTSQIFGALSPVPRNQEGGGGETSPAAQVSLPSVTLLVNKDILIIGDSIVFSGSSQGISAVVLTVFGPGTYGPGVTVGSSKPNSIGVWSFTWTPGTKIQAGSYTVVAGDGKNTTSNTASFKAIGGGVVSVVPSMYAAAKGSTILFSGRCSTGADTVRLVLSGPERYSGGVELGTASVAEDRTWSYRYKLDPTMPTGSYTITAVDVPKTTSGSSQFTVGYIS